MAQVRVNISIEDTALNLIDQIAENEGKTRSAMIREMTWFWSTYHYQIETLKERNRKLGRLEDLIENLDDEISEAPDYETRAEMKRDAYYQVKGCLSVK